MPKLTSIITKVGDRGETMVADGTRRPKSDQMFDVLGNFDELSASIGVCGAILRSQVKQKEQCHLIIEQLEQIQHSLLDLGAEVAWFGKKHIKSEVMQGYIDALEQNATSWNSILAPLKNFILPGGDLAVSQLHLTRAVCRRTERSIVKMINSEENFLRYEMLQYINRLSDYLFIVARVLSDNEQIWTPAETE